MLASAFTHRPGSIHIVSRLKFSCLRKNKEGLGSNSLPSSLIAHMNSLLSKKMSQELEQNVTENAKPIRVHGVALHYENKVNYTFSS